MPQSVNCHLAVIILKTASIFENCMFINNFTFNGDLFAFTFNTDRLGLQVNQTPDPCFLEDSGSAHIDETNQTSGSGGPAPKV